MAASSASIRARRPAASFSNSARSVGVKAWLRRSRCSAMCEAWAKRNCLAFSLNLAMFRPEDESLVYVMHSSGQTTRLVIYGKYETSKHCTCTDLALMARASCPQPRLDGLDHFFGIWRRSVSWGRVLRVLGKDEDEPIGADALARMSREAGLLGFVRKQGGSGLCLDWVDPERLKAGHAPLTFEVVGTTVHEAYGPEPLELRTWGDWNRYLISVMNW